MIFITEENELSFQTDKRQVLYFYLATTPFHKKMIKMLESAEKKFGDTTIFYGVDLEFFKTFIKRFDLQQSPTVILFEGGKKMKRIKGLHGTDEFLGIFDQVYSAPKKILPEKMEMRT